MESNWSQAYRDYGADVYRFLMFYTGNREDAEDITQEAFLRVFRKQRDAGVGGADGAQLKSLLLTVARNIAIDRFRQGKARQRLRHSLQRASAVSALDDDRLIVAESAAALHSAIQSLKPTYRSVVILRGIEEHSLAETAEILNWNENKVKVTYHRALKTLRARLSSEMPEMDVRR